MDICRQLIGYPMADRFIRDIVKCDEKWVYYRNSDASKERLGPHQPAKIIVKIIYSASKVMCVRWNFEDVIHWEFSPNWRAVDADFILNLESVNEIPSTI